MGPPTPAHGVHGITPILAADPVKAGASELQNSAPGSAHHKEMPDCYLLPSAQDPHNCPVPGPDATDVCRPHLRVLQPRARPIPTRVCSTPHVLQPLTLCMCRIQAPGVMLRRGVCLPVNFVTRVG